MAEGITNNEGKRACRLWFRAVFCWTCATQWGIIGRRKWVPNAFFCLAACLIRPFWEATIFLCQSSSIVIFDFWNTFDLNSVVGVRKYALLGSTPKCWLQQQLFAWQSSACFREGSRYFEVNNRCDSFDSFVYYWWRKLFVVFFQIDPSSFMDLCYDDSKCIRNSWAVSLLTLVFFITILRGNNANITS